MIRKLKLINNKAAYKEILKTKKVPLYFQPGWMDSVCIKGDWDVIIARNTNNEPEGVLLYHHRKYRGFRLILMPPSTSYNGILLFFPQGMKTHSRISFENQTIEKLYRALPPHDLYYQQWHPDYQNWLSLYWKGYRQSTRYTYRIDLSKGKDQLWSSLKSSVRTHIRNAEPLTEIRPSDFSTYWHHLVKAFHEKAENVPFNGKVLENIYEDLNRTGNCRVQLIYEKATDKILGGILATSDHNTTYYLSGFHYRSNDLTSFYSTLLWHVIRSSDTQYFDFEGSIIKEIEHFFRSFGGQLTSHYKIWKINHPLLKFIFKFKKLDFIE